MLKKKLEDGGPKSEDEKFSKIAYSSSINIKICKDRISILMQPLLLHRNCGWKQNVKTSQIPQTGLSACFIISENFAIFTLHF